MLRSHLTLTFLLFNSFLFATSQQEEFIYNGLSSKDPNQIPLKLNGVSEISNTGILKLTNDTSRLIGRGFYPTPLQFRNTDTGTAFSFSTAFAFAIVPEYAKLGGHGLAFTIAPSMEFKGALPSQYLGLLNSSDLGNRTNNLFAVEFDTVQDFEFNDINDNHVGINLNSMISNSSTNASYYGDDGTKIDIMLKGGNTIQAWIEYDGVRKLITVSLSPNSSKPKKPTLSYSVDLSLIFMDKMYIGFSASTGLLASSHYIFGWSFKMNGAAKSLDLSSLPSLPKPKTKKTTLALAVALAIFATLVVIASIGGYIIYKIKNADIIEPWELNYGPRRFLYDDLKRATRGFRDINLLGFGGFGKVYKGVFPDSKIEVAVKRISHGSRQGLPEFVAEIASIGRLRHRNLVQLQGWCRRRNDLLLVYDYMPNGSLDRFLFRDDSASSEKINQHLSWSQRFHILQGIASALLYLHEEWEHVVLHRDVKASNVLVDADFNGRLGDFGLAKLHEHGANPSTTRVVGTVGYLAPEMTRTGRATTGSDVFAFGAMVLEVVCGRRPIEPKAIQEEAVLVDWVRDRWAAGSWADVVDPKLEGEYNRNEVAVALKVGLMCSHPDQAARPSMREVVRYLESSDASTVPKVATPEQLRDYEKKSNVGFDAFVQAYPSSSFDKDSNWSTTTGSKGERSEVDVGPNGYNPVPQFLR
jgi:serine/threonine protein kinase